MIGEVKKCRSEEVNRGLEEVGGNKKGRVEKNVDP